MYLWINSFFSRKNSWIGQSLHETKLCFSIRQPRANYPPGRTCPLSWNSFVSEGTNISCNKSDARTEEDKLVSYQFFQCFDLIFFSLIVQTSRNVHAWINFLFVIIAQDTFSSKLYTTPTLSLVIVYLLPLQISFKRKVT